MSHVIFSVTNICLATWLEREEIRQIHVKSNRFADVGVKPRYVQNRTFVLRNVNNPDIIDE